MPKKACCCGEGGNWVAVPCRYWGGLAFSGLQFAGTTGFCGADYSQVTNNFIQSLKTHPVYGSSGFFGWQHPYYQFPDITFAVSGWGVPPNKVRLVDCESAGPNTFRGYAIGTSLIPITTGGGYGTDPFGGGYNSDCNELICWEYDLDTERDIIYKAWGAGGGGVDRRNYPGGHGAYAQKKATYSKNYFACVGYGGLGYDPGSSFTGWTGDIDTIPGGGAQGYGAWGGGAAFVAENILQPENAIIIAGGGAGAGNAGKGGHGGVTFGERGESPEGGYGGTQTGPGTGGTMAESGIDTKGGRGAKGRLIIDGEINQEVVLRAGGGGAGGKFGGGGGGMIFSLPSTLGGGGGGGSSTLDPHSRPASDLGPPNMCDPDYWWYNNAAIGGYQRISGSGGYVPYNPYTNGTGQWGKIVLSYAASQCLCDGSLSEIPEKTYICLTNEQAYQICSQTQNCCGGNCGPSGPVLNEDGPEGLPPNIQNGNCGPCGACGASGASGYNPCGSLVNFDTQIVSRGETADEAGDEESAQDLPYGSGIGGAGLGAFICPNTVFCGGFTGLSGFSGYLPSSGLCGSCGCNYTPTGEIAEVLYKTFRYEGELYYLLFQCGVYCDSDHLLPEDAEFTDIGCRPYGDCCQGLWATPVCQEKKPKNPPPQCWSGDNCPCSPPFDCPSKSFVSCVDNIDDYPDVFWTKKDDWYYVVSKTSLWAPFGDISYIEQGSIGDVILENPCCEGDGGFGGGPVVGAGGDCDEDDGDTTEPTGGCCSVVEEAWDGKSPWKAQVEVNMQWEGKGQYFEDCSVINTCDCAIAGGASESDSDSFTVTANAFGYYSEFLPAPNCPTPALPPDCEGGQFTNLFKEFEYELIPGGFFGSGLQERCYTNYSQPCLPQNTGLPDEFTSMEPGVSDDALIRITSECVISDPENCDSIGIGYEPNPAILSGGILGAPNPCTEESDPGGPDSFGPRVYANGCRVGAYVAEINRLAGGKYVAVDISGGKKYWLGAWRDEQAGIPGDVHTETELTQQFITVGQKTIKRSTWTLYYSSPSYSVRVKYRMKNIPKCCAYQPAMEWYQSGCGRTTEPQYACSPCVGCACPDIDESYVVPTFKTLAQYEESPTVSNMINPKCYIDYGTAGLFICPDVWDDLSGSQTCSVTLT